MVHVTNSRPRFVGQLCQTHWQNHTINSFCGFMISKCRLALPLILFRLGINSFVTWQGLVIHALDEKHTKTNITMSNGLKHKWRQHSEHKLWEWSMCPQPTICDVTVLGRIMHKRARITAFLRSGPSHVQVNSFGVVICVHGGEAQTRQQIIHPS